MSRTSEQTTTGNMNTSTAYSLEEMIAYIRLNPDAALGVHQHLTEYPYLQHLNAPLESSTLLTPKRNLDLSDNDGAQVSKQQRVLSNGKQKRSTNQTNPSAVPNLAQQPMNSHPLEDQQQPSEQQHCRIPSAHLKRAVASNLPCFLIEYDQVDNSKKRPSDVTAASLIANHFRQQGISITFSLVGHTGNKLKLGVNNKEAYAILVSTDKWPTQINNININIIKPKFTPDSFALVVRYAPLQYSDEFVKDEIECNLQSSENVRRIQYRLKRRTNDFRFIVKDIQEYNSTLKFGRISIGNSIFAQSHHFCLEIE